MGRLNSIINSLGRGINNWLDGGADADLNAPGYHPDKTSTGHYEGRRIPRSKFIRNSAIAAGALAIAPGLLKGSITNAAEPSTGPNEKAKWDVSYLWHPDLEAVLDYKEEVEEVLGDNVDLRVVKGKENYGLIYNRNATTKAKAEFTAREHSKKLEAADLEGAVEIEDSGYSYIYNASFAKGPNLERLKQLFEQAYKSMELKLGDKFDGKRLVIEKADAGQYALVYKLYEDLESAKGFADSMSSKLGMAISWRAENGCKAVYDASDYFGRSLEEEAKATTKPAKPLSETKRPEKRQAQPKPKLDSSGGEESDLEKRLQDHINELRKEGTLKVSDKTAWSVYDFETGEKLASINEDAPMQCASMVKPFVALAYMHEVEKGRQIYGDQAKRQMERMLRRSKNDATNWFMKALGGPDAVQRMIRENYGSICVNTSVAEYIPSGGRTYKNKASAHDYSRFLFELWNDQLPGSREIKRVMGLKKRSRIYSGTKVPSGTNVYSKTGTTAMLCGDMGILSPIGRDGKRHPYTLVGIIQSDDRKRGYSRIGGKVIRSVSNIVYDYMKKKHDLR